MDILDQAMALELERERLYRSQAKPGKDEGIVYIFSRLADQECWHYDTFKKMRSDVPALPQGHGCGRETSSRAY